MMRLKVSCVFLLCLCFLTGCASLGTYNPATGRSEFIFISTPEEVSLGNNLHQQLAGQYKFDLVSDNARRVREIGQRLARTSDRQDYTYEFYVIDQDELNAFTTPGGKIYIYSGLVDKLTRDDQIASVLAHEIGHCAARHTVKKFQAAMGYDLITSLVLGQVSEGAQQIASMSSNMLMNVVFSAYGRQDEFEADRLGIKYMDLAGYDIQASVEVLSLLEREPKGGGPPLILRSHPYPSDRIRAVKKEIELVRGSALMVQ